MEIDALYQKFKQCSGINTDTRNIDEHSMFFALKGPNFNANMFAASALNKGSKYAVVDDPQVAISDRFILVEDILLTLQQLSKYHRNKLSIPIIGITGSNGKTTTKELINEVLSTQYKVSATKGNLNNHIGVPLTLLNINAEDEIVIVEMGANHEGEIELLCNLSSPDHGLITNIGKAHLEGFGTLEKIISTKKALYDSIKKTGGLAFINKSDPLLNKLSLGNNCSYYLDENGLNGKLIENASGEMIFEYFSSHYQSPQIKTHLFGNYNLENAMAAVAIGIHFKIENKNIVKALNLYQPQNNRSQRFETENNNIILDAYNANPTSTLLALEHFLSIKNENKIAILGDMLELGDYASEEHQKIVDFVVANKIETLFVGPIYASCKNIEPSTTFSNVNELIKLIKSYSIINKTILFKGSRGIKLEKLVDYL
jgi:UDP-N-acetylmuramoyl-tripeptide--D-alanyl-D-alanine ligase